MLKPDRFSCSQNIRLKRYPLVPLYVVISLLSKVADVIAFMYVVDGKTTRYLYMMLADVKAMVVDGIATGQLYFNFSSEMFNRTSSQMCGRWNFAYISI